MKLLPFSKIVEINPRVGLDRGQYYPFVSMGVVEPSKRYISSVEQRSYKGGGAKFIAGDTLFARITPCLENGKIVQYKPRVGNKAAFGSTEFFVFRAYPHIADPGYVYYLAKSDLIRKPAEKSMSGASGRQRADLNSIKNVEVPAPTLYIQRKIAAILSAYDNLIENNLRRIRILEEMAQALYREWFVHFRFPGHEKVRFVDSPLGKIPEGWAISSLGDYISVIESGKRPRGGVKGITSGVPSIGAENIIGIGKHDFTKEKYIPVDFFKSMNKGIVQHGDVALYKDGAYIGRSTYLRDGYPYERCCVNEHVFIIRTTGDRLTQNMLYAWLQHPDTIKQIRLKNANAAQPGINQKAVKSLKIIVPPKHLTVKYDSIVEPIFKEIVCLAKKNIVLKSTRDLLLPKLISGELDVSELDIDVSDVS